MTRQEQRDRRPGYRPFLVTIISLVMCWNFLQSSASSRVTLSSLSVGSPFSRPAWSSLSTALSSRDMQRSAEPGLAWTEAVAAEPDSLSSCNPSTFIWITQTKTHSLLLKQKRWDHDVMCEFLFDQYSADFNKVKAQRGRDFSLKCRDGEDVHFKTDWDK